MLMRAGYHMNGKFPIRTQPDHDGRYPVLVRGE